MNQLNATFNTIIFDLGGVMVDWNPRYLYRKIFSTAEEMEFFLREIATSDWNEEQDGGRSLAEGTAWLVAKHPDYAEAIMAFYSRWPEMLGGEISTTVALFQEMRRLARYKFYALTNWSAETFPFALDRYAWLHDFDGILVSGEEKMRKPDPRFYELLLSRFAIAPGQAVFIDDNLRNVSAAQTLGITSIWYQGTPQLRESLTQLGIIA